MRPNSNSRVEGHVLRCAARLTLGVMRHLIIALLLLLAAAPANAMAAGWSDPAVVGGRTSSPVSVGAGDDGSAVALWQSKSDLFAAIRGAGASFGAPAQLGSN